MDETLHPSLAPIAADLDAAKSEPDRYTLVASGLAEISDSTRDASLFQLAHFASLLGNLVQLAESSADHAHAESFEIHEFIGNGLRTLSIGLSDGPDARDEINRLTDEAHQRWQECLELLTENELASDNGAWDRPDLPTSSLNVDSSEQVNDDQDPDPASPSSTAPDNTAINLILGSLTGNDANQDHSETNSSTGVAPVDSSDDSKQVVNEGSNDAVRMMLESLAENEDAATVEPTPVPTSNSSGLFASGGESQAQQSERELNDDSELDPELREAYTDDAQRCLSSIESSLMKYEDEPANRQPLQQVCRELHTLKGASASVGLEKLASFLHQVEDNLQAAVDASSDKGVDLQPIFRAVDAVRERVNGPVLDQHATETATPDASAVNANNRAATIERIVDAGGASQDSVRVKATQLDRLMDMLAELVMLRNRRESRVESLKSIHSELIRCVTRFRSNEQRHNARPNRYRASSQAEIANDLLAIGGSLRELYEPVGEENMAISRFIRQFRQELIQLRRVPVKGLFQRLQRSARDAARVEGKKVRIELVGENVGLETSIQQQLYEPLLHIVRNAVSHGVEKEEQRVAAGKSPAGTVTLEANGGSNLLVITVRDDGRGLDYDALRRRGLAMGLIPSDRPVSRSDLAQLIFHPGFSTKSSTSEVSGRGVGMDVVLAALDRMHSWVEVDSVPGQGSSVRLLIPLHSVIEHVMVFRAGGQEFGVATHNVTFAGEADVAEYASLPKARLSHIFEQLGQRKTECKQMLVLSNHQQDATRSADRYDDCFGLLVDEVVGPEEVVVRALPNLLAAQPLFSGVTLSGVGDIMLLFDSKQLIQCGRASVDEESVVIPHASPRRSRTTKRVLIVDDSRTSRRALIQATANQPFDIDEACDGSEALRRIQENDYDLIFTDLEMPEMTGLQLLQAVRSDPRTQEVPVIMVSSRDEPEFREQAMAVGVSDYLIKPVSESVVTLTLDKLSHRALESVEA